jgi:hypothetical protein
MSQRPMTLAFLRVSTKFGAVLAPPATDIAASLGRYFS